MNLPRPSRLATLLGDLLELDPARRREAVAALHAATDPCAAEVTRLLALHDRDPGGLQLPDGGWQAAGPDPSVAVDDPLLGAEFDGFTLVQPIGAGAMGRVYEARQQSPQRRVAVKLLIAPTLGTGESLARFHREAQLLAALDHPGICRIHCAGTAMVGGLRLPYLAMEFVSGSPIDQATRGIDRGALLELVAGIADAVQHAHAHGVVHRDLKPANLLVQRRDAPDGRTTWTAKVLDFGVSRVLDGDGADGLRTESGMVIGTPAYMSPEQRRSARVGPTADVYALGVVLFELLTGRRPFVGDDTDVAGAALRRRAPRLRTVAGCRDIELEAVLARCLERDPERRYPTAGELAADLRRARDGRPVTARHLTPMVRLGRWLGDRAGLVGTVAVAIGLVTAGLIVLVQLGGRVATAEATARSGAMARERAAYLVSLQEAEGALRADDVATARRTLASVGAARRGFEWRFLWGVASQLEQNLRSTQSPRPPTWPLSTRHDVNGTEVYAPSHEVRGPTRQAGTVELLDLRDWSVQVRVSGLPARPARVASAGQGRWLVCSGPDGLSVLSVYSIATGAVIASDRTGAADQSVLTVSPLGDLVALGGGDGTLHLLGLPGLQRRATVALAQPIEGIAFAPRGDRLAVVMQPDHLVVLALDGTRIAACDTRGTKPIYPTFDASGRRLASLNWTETNLYLWDADSGRLLRRQAIPEHAMSLVGIPGADRVAVGAADGSVQLFALDVDEGDSWSPLLTLRDTDQTIHNLWASPDGTTLVAGLHSGWCHVWRAPASVAESEVAAWRTAGGAASK